MNQTQKNIKAYKEALPDLRERVIAVALLLVMSMAMMTSATFAWLSISASPELTSVNTTVASNGNLEIALVQGDGSREPATSAVGDSLLDIAERNTTWGNLINLSDASYGLDNLTLRPAQLNRTALLTNPLYGAVYTTDGRIQKLTSNFAYTQWIPPEGNIPGYFEVSNRFGVRAISSTKIVAQGFAQTYLVMKEDAISANTMAGNAYLAIASNQTYMENLAYIMGTHMTATVNNGASDPENLRNPTLDPSAIRSLIDMYDKFLDAMDLEAEALAKLLNFQLLIKYGIGNYTPLSGSYLLARDANGNFTTTQAVLESQGLKITDLAEFQADYKQLQDDMTALETLRDSAMYKYKYLTTNDDGKEVQDPTIRDMNEIVTDLVNLNACTLNGKLIGKISTTDAAGYMNQSCRAVITNGVLWEFERRTGAHIYVGEEYNNRKGLAVEATAYIASLNWTQGGTVYAIIYTDLNSEKAGTEPVDSLFMQDIAYAESQYNGEAVGGVESAKDTYGMAIDLWVRTNAAGAYLTLEGNILTESEERAVMGKNASGVEVPLYSFTRTVESEVEGEDPVTYEIEVYKVDTTDDDGNVTATTWYNASTHTAYTAEEMEGITPIAKKETVDVVIGYEGENRVWDRDSNSLISVNATTQGSGSCYVYYADTPEDQERSLELLKSMNVVFVDGGGKLLAEAYMDTEHYYAVNGRVIVPLMLSSSSINLGFDENNDVIYGITPLEQNVAKRVTALVYLDGTDLDNEDVLAASAIQGQLNIQFGSSQMLEPIRNEELENAERTVSAVVDISSFDYDTHEGDMEVTVTVTVAGDVPQTVSGFFMRAISATQGSREEPMIFRPTANAGEYVATYIFDGPGEYVLRTVRLDGVDYDLEGDYPTVTVEGFSIAGLSCEEADGNRNMYVMTANNSTVAHLNLSFETNDITRMPQKVQGRYVKDGDEATTVSVDFTLDATTQVWSGTATFRQSGEYTLQYLVLDGKYTELAENMRQTAQVYLGMRVSVDTSSPTRFVYKPSEEDFPDYLDMLVKIMDNTGEEKEGLTNVWLYYSAQGGNRYMRAELTWDAGSGYYKGQFVPANATAGPGNYQFTYVGVGDSTLTTATTSPTFQIMSPNPPAYVNTTTAGYQFNTAGTATMDVHLSDAAGTTVQATIHSVNENKDHLIIGVPTSESTNEDGTIITKYSFTIPYGISGSSQDGDWQLTDLTIWDAFSSDGTEYTEDEPLEIDLSNTSNSTKVVATVKVAFPAGQSLTLGKSGDNITAAFLASQNANTGLNVNITDYFGNALVDADGNPMVSNVTLQYAYNGGSETNGGYSRTDLTAANAPVIDGATVTIALDAVTGGTNFAQSAAARFLYAGNYDVTFTYVLNGQTQSYSGNTKLANTPEISVWSVAPSARISSINPSTSHNQCTITAKQEWWGTNYVYTDSTANPQKTDTSATVYIRCTRGSWPLYAHNFTKPTVTISLAGYGSAASASLAFTKDGSTDIYMYNGSTKVNTYVWSGNGNISRTFGYTDGGTGNDSKTPAGTLTATELILKDSAGNEYKVNITDITISNPN